MCWWLKMFFCRFFSARWRHLKWHTNEISQHAGVNTVTIHGISTRRQSCCVLLHIKHNFLYSILEAIIPFRSSLHFILATLEIIICSMVKLRWTTACNCAGKLGNTWLVDPSKCAEMQLLIAWNCSGPSLPNMWKCAELRPTKCMEMCGTAVCCSLPPNCGFNLQEVSG